MTVPAIPYVATVPFPPQVSTFTRFLFAFEAYEFTDWIDESLSWKQTCYIGDWSPLVKFSVKGPDALKFWSSIVVNSFERFDIGQAKHAVLPNDDGKVIGEGVLMRVSEDELYFTSGPGALWAIYKFHTGSWDAEFIDHTADRTIQQVQGPTSLAVMEEACGQSLRDIEFMRFRGASVDGMPIYLLRQGMSGDVGYEIHGDTDQGAAVYARILEVGQKHGIRQLGGRAKMVNHVEACFPTANVDYIPAWYGTDEEDAFKAVLSAAGPIPFDAFRGHGGSHGGDYRELMFSPVELGWGRSIKFDHDFPGAEVLRVEKEQPRRVMRTLVWNADDVLDVIRSYFAKGEPLYKYMEWPRELLGKVVGDKVLANGDQVGIATSRCYSVYFREMLSLAVIDVAHAEPGTEVTLLWGDPGGNQKQIRATVAPAPYKTDRRRVDLRPATASAR